MKRILASLFLATSCTTGQITDFVEDVVEEVTEDVLVALGKRDLAQWLVSYANALMAEDQTPSTVRQAQVAQVLVEALWYDKPIEEVYREEWEVLRPRLKTLILAQVEQTPAWVAYRLWVLRQLDKAVRSLG